MVGQINNAGIVSGKSLLETPNARMRLTMEVNTISHFWTTKAVLPGMIARNHGHIVTVASAAGLLGVTGLADYFASKFGAFGFNEALRMELKAKNINGVSTTVVCPFYINTGMFDGVTTAGPLLPILEPDYAAGKIVKAIRRKQEWLCMPRILYILPLLRSVLPVSLFDGIMTLLGVSSTMDHFVGRSDGKKVV